MEPGICQLFLDTAVHGILRRYTIASPQPYFLSPCSGVGTGPWVGASGWGDLTMTPVDSIEIFHLGSGSHVEETAQLYTFPPSRVSKPPQGKCLYTGPLGLTWSRCPAAPQGANTSPHPPPRVKGLLSSLSPKLLAQYWLKCDPFYLCNGDEVPGSSRGINPEIY